MGKRASEASSTFLEKHSSNFHSETILLDEERKMLSPREKAIRMVQQNAEATKREKLRTRFEIQQEAEATLQAKRQTIEKAKGVHELIKSEHAQEQGRNKAVFRSIAREEKTLRKDLHNRKTFEAYREKLERRMEVLSHHRKQLLKKDEAKFYLSFAQAKNVIQKNMLQGFKERIKQDSLAKLKETLHRQRDSSRSTKMEPIKGVLIENTLSPEELRQMKAATPRERSEGWMLRSPREGALTERKEGDDPDGGRRSRNSVAVGGGGPGYGKSATGSLEV